MDSFEKNYNKVLHFLSFRPRSTKEIKDYLIKNKVSVKDQQMIIDKLTEYKFLDDFEFARMWVMERTRLKPKAWRIIKVELKQKGITDEIIDVLKDNLETPMPSDFQIAFSLAEKRMRRYKNLDKKELFEKMGRFLASKGFDYDTIKEVFTKISK